VKSELASLTLTAGTFKKRLEGVILIPVKDEFAAAVKRCIKRGEKSVCISRDYAEK